MEPRNKVPLALLTDCLTFKLSYKASYSEINKDLVQINEAIGFSRKSDYDSEPKKKPQKPLGRKKAKYIEEINGILGLASLMNENIEAELGPRRSASDISEAVKIPKTKKTSALAKKSGLKYTRAGTHLRIAYLIKGKKAKKNCN